MLIKLEVGEVDLSFIAPNKSCMNPLQLDTECNHCTWSEVISDEAEVKRLLWLKTDFKIISYMIHEINLQPIFSVVYGTS